VEEIEESATKGGPEQGTTTDTGLTTLSVGFNNTEAKRLVLQAGSYLVRAGCVSDLDFWSS